MIADEEVKHGLRFVVTDDLRGGALEGLKGRVLGWARGWAAADSLIETHLDGDDSPTVFYPEEITLLPIVDQLAALT